MRIGIIGAGKIGAALGRLWSDSGHDVMLSSRHSEKTPLEAAAYGEVIVTAVPLAAIASLARNLSFDGKVVLDPTNAYIKRDGEYAREAMSDPRGTSAWAAGKFPGARWVKAFNTVYFQVLEREAHRNGARIAIPLASDDGRALAVASQLVRDAGFEPVIAGALQRGRDFEPQMRAYNTGMTGHDVRRVLALR